MDALLVDIFIIILYSLLIVLICLVGLKKSDKIYRIIFLNLSVMYFLCLAVSSFLPTAMSSRENLFVPLIGFIEALKSQEFINIINYISHMFLNFILFIPLGIFVSIMLLLNANDNFVNVFIYSLCIALIIEVVQIFLPYRSAEFDDFIFEILGAMSGYLIVKLNKSKKVFRNFLSMLLP